MALKIYSERPENKIKTTQTLNQLFSVPDGSSSSTSSSSSTVLNCVKPTHETLFADVPNLSIENATKMGKDRKLWSTYLLYCNSPL